MQKCTYDILAANLAKLKRNKEGVPMRDLRTKYAIAYGNLCRQIDEETDVFWKQICFGGLMIRRGRDPDLGAFWKKSNGILQEEKAAGTFRKLREIAHEQYDIDAMHELIVKRLWFRIWYEAYAPYWCSCCKMNGDRIENDLLGPGWHWKEEWSSWTDKREQAVMIMLPPSIEACRKEQEKWRT